MNENWHWCPSCHVNLVKGHEICPDCGQLFPPKRDMSVEQEITLLIYTLVAGSILMVTAVGIAVLYS